MGRPRDQNVSGKLVRQVLLDISTGKRARGRPRTRWRDYISDVACYHLGVEPAELFEIAVDREMFRLLWLLFPQPSSEEKRL